LPEAQHRSPRFCGVFATRTAGHAGTPFGGHEGARARLGEAHPGG
jgi:hypothetical protein